jgi:hypothetical protein
MADGGRSSRGGPSTGGNGGAAEGPPFAMLGNDCPDWNGGGRKPAPGDGGLSSRRGLSSLGGENGLPYGGKVEPDPPPLA